MRIGVLIQARMSSRRLPGKALRRLAGKPMVQWVVEAAQRATPDVVVATSTDPTDDAVVEFCEDRSIACFRGSLGDVAGRFIAAANHYGWDAIVRLSADSPLLDARLISEALGYFADGSWDLVTNVFPRTYPKGQSVEVIRVAVLRAAYSHMSAAQREHVTSYFYAHADDWRIYNFTSGQAWGAVNLCVDTLADVLRIEAILQRMDSRQGIKLEELVLWKI